MEHSQPLVTEPEDEIDLRIQEFGAYMSAIDEYCGLDEVGKLDPVLRDTKKKLDKVQALLANARDTNISTEDELELRQEYERLKEAFCQQIRLISHHQKVSRRFATASATLLRDKGIIAPESVPQVSSLISAFSLATAQYISNKRDLSQ